MSTPQSGVVAVDAGVATRRVGQVRFMRFNDESKESLIEWLKAGNCVYVRIDPISLMVHSSLVVATTSGKPELVMPGWYVVQYEDGGWAVFSPGDFKANFTEE